jgi:hypothetical protein
MLVCFLLSAAPFSSLALGVASAAASSTSIHRGEGRLRGSLRLNANPHSCVSVVMEKLYILRDGVRTLRAAAVTGMSYPFGIGLMRLQNIITTIGKDMLTRFERRLRQNMKRHQLFSATRSIGVIIPWSLRLSPIPRAEASSFRCRGSLSGVTCVTRNGVDNTGKSRPVKRSFSGCLSQVSVPRCNRMKYAEGGRAWVLHSNHPGKQHAEGVWVD